MNRGPILWGEGLFLRPHHLQQQDLYHREQGKHVLRSANPFAWGVSDLQIDTESLRSGILRFNRINVIFPDGDFFNAPGIDQLPLPLALEDRITDGNAAEFHLALHHLSHHGGNCAESLDKPGKARYFIAHGETSDLYSQAAAADVAVLSQIAHIKASDENLEHYQSIPVVRIRRTASNGFEIDETFFPPALSIRSAPALYGLLRRQIDALKAKAEALYGFHREPSKNIIEFRSGDIASFWLLHTVSSACAALGHIFRNPDLSPDRLYQELLHLTGGLLTFSKSFRLDDLPAYDHRQPAACFGRLDQILRELLETVISTRYFAITLSQPKPAFFSGRLDSEKIDGNTHFYLSVAAAHPQSEIIESVPSRIKLGAPDDVDKIVLSAVSGVRLTHAAQVPAAIPVRPNACYFALDHHGPLFARMLKAQSVMIYVPESYTDLSLELIAVTQ